MRKGFTLVEIIISIVLILVVGTSATIFFVNKGEKVNSENEDILNAAKLYANVEKDSNGYTYMSQVLSGANGVQIPLKSLANKGYIDESVVDKVYETNGTPNSGEDYYILLLAAQSEYDPNQANYCEEGEITVLLSWTTTNMEPVYLCSTYKEPKEEPLNVEEIQEQVSLKYTEDKIAVSNEFITNLEAAGKDTSAYTADENGIFTFHHDIAAGNYVYTYYRGAVNNNYVKLGQENGEDLYWRIVWFRDDKKMKLVLDKTITLTTTNKNGNEMSIKNQKVYLFRGNSYYILSSNIKSLCDSETLDTTNDKYTECDLYIPNESFLPSFIDLTIDVTNSSNFYHQKTVKWFNKTSLATEADKYEFITETNNFCINNSYRDMGSGEKYYPSTNFDCANGELEKSYSPKNYSTIPSYYSSKVGFLTYGDCVQAGLGTVTSETSLVSSGNYLISDTNSFAIQEKYEEDWENDFYYNYYINDYGIKHTTAAVERELLYYQFHVYNESKTQLIKTFTNYSNGSSGTKYMDISTLYADSIKPAIILDLTNYKLSDNTGTKSDAYTIVAR